MKIAAALLALTLTGCGTLPNVNRNSVAPTENDRDVLLAAVAQNQTTLASKLDNNIEKGLVVKNSTKDVVRDTKGEVVLLNNSAIMGESDIELRLNSFHELADRVDDLDLRVATRSNAQVGTNQVYGNAGFDGLVLRLKGAGGAVLDANNIKAPSEGRALEAAANAEILKAYWEGKKGYAATVITTGGTAVSGIIKEVLKSTPVGAAGAAVELLMVKPDGKNEIVTTESR